VTDFSRLDAADRWLGVVRDWLYDKTHDVGIDAWNTDPALRQARERAARLAALARARRAREAQRLAVNGTPASRARLSTVRGRDRVPARS